MIDLLGRLKQNNKFCTGCGACYNICPVGAITKVADKQGFLYPEVSEKCISCEQCTKVCPKLNPFISNTEEPPCYAARANDEIREKSSSGGMFTLLAESILEQGGVVVGATMEPDYSVHHICVTNKDELIRLRQSKYVQSDTEFVYKEVKKYLQNQKKVLFSGCPCQIAAARNYFGNNPNLYLVDILCHGVPSVQMWKDYLKENFNLAHVERVEFRSKKNGWRSDQLRVFYKNGVSESISWPESAYEEGFQRNISLRDGCDDCEFGGHRRQGDITMGDFWRVEEYDQTLNDKKGTSVVLVNNRKGEQLFKIIHDKAIDVRKVPIEAARFNRLHTKFSVHPQRERFKLLYPDTHSFTDSIFQCRHALYDIGLVAYYTVPNYGGVLTQYALYRTLTEMGYSVLMIERPQDSRAKLTSKTPQGPELFTVNHYPQYALSKYYPSIAAMKFLNLQCKTFISGSDQMFNNNGYTWFNKFMVQNFVKDNHRKIAYAASWGHDRIWGEETDRAEESYFLKKFDYFSVREDVAVDLCRREFGVEATWVLDPVFLCDISNFEYLIQHSTKPSSPSPFLFSYILDLDDEKERIVFKHANANGLDVCTMFDAQELLLHKDSPLHHYKNIVSDAKLEDWIAFFKNSDYVITDSFHGMCMCLILHKQFMVFVNRKRGEVRFSSLLKLLGLEERMAYTADEMEAKLHSLAPVNFAEVDRILQRERTRCINWLRNAIEEDKDKKKPLSEFDILDGRCDAIRRFYDQKLDKMQKLNDERYDKLQKQLEEALVKIKNQDGKIKSLNDSSSENETSKLLSDSSQLKTNDVLRENIAQDIKNCQENYLIHAIKRVFKKISKR